MYVFCLLTVLVVQVAADTLYFRAHQDVPLPYPGSTDGVMCPDGRSECAIGQTCCRLTSGAYGCCPYPRAVCCKDHLHCCPERSRCDLRRKKCSRGKQQLPLSVHLPARLISDNSVEHLSRETIILSEEKNKLQQEQNELIRNKIALTVEEIKLTKEEIKLAQNENELIQNDIRQTQNEVKLTENEVVLTENELAKGVNRSVKKDVVCPGGQSECPQGSTCCKLASDQYGCCPLPKAVCCSDHTHCCPSGTTCDTAKGKCNRGEISTSWLKKQPALPRASVGSVVCPGGQSQCPDGSTCCKLASGQYGCCPLPQAVCCSDHTHCCPSGTTCDVTHGRCQRGYSTIRWHETLLSRPVSQLNETDVKCPDGQSECPDGSTCCKLASGQYGCCPLPKAVCCSDHTHCCPTGTTCDTAQGKCIRGEVSTPWLKKQPALPRVGNVVCPGGQSQCPDGSTCCKLASGQYGCCPLPKAVCCSDHVHCCPAGTTCGEGKCNRDHDSLPWVTKLPARPVVKSIHKEVVCPDGKSQCPEESTCCKLASGQYGCCPFPKAQCCSDHRHCCPQGSSCDVSKGSCVKNGVSVPWVGKHPAMPKLKSHSP